jgi:DHA2 family multidrug resistance protein-like MFS transporter
VSPHIDSKRPRLGNDGRCGAVGGGKQVSGVRKQATPSLGQRDAALVADEKPLADRVFQTADSLRQSLLGQVKLGGGPAEVESLGDDDKRAHLRDVQVHTFNLGRQPAVVKRAKELLDTPCRTEVCFPTEVKDMSRTTNSTEVAKRTSWTAVVALGMAVFMAALDMTVVAVALPSIGKDFAATPALSQWVVLAYSLPMVALIVPAGRWADWVNLRRAFLLAITGFAVASALIGAAPALGVLLGGRVLQGAFGALISALVLAIAATVVRPQERGRAMGIVAMLGPLGAVTGPGLGGLLVAQLGWRSVFFINLPVCVVAMLLAARSIPGSGRLRAPRTALLGDAALVAVATLALLLALDVANDEGWAQPAPILLLLVTVGAVALWTRIPSAHPVIGVLRHRGLSGQLVGLVLVALVGGATYFLGSYLLQGMLGRNPGEAGAVLLAMPLAMAVASPLGGHAADRWGARIVAVIGVLVILAGALLLLPLDASWSGAQVAWRLAIIGIGSGLFSGPNSSAIMTTAPRTLIGTVSALSGLGRNLGFALGPAVGTLLWHDQEPTAAAMRPAFILLAAMPLLALIAIAGSRMTKPRSSAEPTNERTGDHVPRPHRWQRTRENQDSRTVPSPRTSDLQANGHRFPRTR